MIDKYYASDKDLLQQLTKAEKNIEVTKKVKDPNYGRMPEVHMKDIVIENLAKPVLEKRLEPLKVNVETKHKFIASVKKPSKFIRVEQPVEVEKTIEKTI